MFEIGDKVKIKSVYSSTHEIDNSFVGYEGKIISIENTIGIPLYQVNLYYLGATDWFYECSFTLIEKAKKEIC